MAVDGFVSQGRAFTLKKKEAQIKEALLHGVTLEGDKRNNFNKIQQIHKWFEIHELERLSYKFDENVLDATKKFEKLIIEKHEVDGLPSTALGMAAETTVSKVSMETKMATVEKAEELLEKLRSASWNVAVQGDYEQSVVIVEALEHVTMLQWW